ncbi:MAG: dTDP-4-dehydrorhamnose reductase [Hyphomonadaceae bacterium]
MDILVLGGAGQVGLEAQALAWPQGASVHAPTRAALDLRDGEGVAAFIVARPWAAIINAAAFTAVDEAETQAAAAWALNAHAPAVIARAAAMAAIPLIHVSTDYVFAGDKAGFYEEDDPIAPINVYGASKAAGEIAVRAAHPQSVIVRTAWVASRHRSNFVKTMLRLAQSAPRLRVVADQHGSPTSAADLARALQTIALHKIADRTAPGGIFHCVNAGDASWRDVAQAVIARAALRRRANPPIDAITTAQFPTPARRPANSRLSARKLEAAFAIRMRPWQEAFAEIVDALVAQEEGVSS